ncbi:MAG: polysaccharide export protein [Syntrophobacteraceae bacterium]|nr:polysaccharide export protein [Syntrophobacteraceae bacterium]
MPDSGPSGKAIIDAGKPPAPGKPPRGIQVIDLTGSVAALLENSQKRCPFSKVFGEQGPMQYVVGPGDLLEVSIWEAPPATLFGSTVIETTSGAAPTALPSSRGATIPDQMVESDGTISIPFAGRIPAAGHTLEAIAAQITKRLQGIAHQPQVLVRLVRNSSAYVTVVGEVKQSVRMPLTPRGERLLDAIASAGGAQQPIVKTMIQVTRGKKVYSLPLETIIRDPRQNILLDPGDVVTAFYQPKSFTVLGATGKNDEVNFEAQGISLIQALGRSGGLNDNRADAKSIFVFRFEPKELMDWPNKPVLTTKDGRVPVVYVANLKDPATFFAAQDFMVKDKDLLYVSNASVAELQKFLNIVMSVAYPAITAIQLTK